MSFTAIFPSIGYTYNTYFSLDYLLFVTIVLS
jgi:hypothetical protein